MGMATTNPDVHFGKDDRSTAVRGEDMAEKGKNWSKHTSRNYAKLGEGLETSSVWNMWGLIRPEGDYRPGRTGTDGFNAQAWRSDEAQAATYVKATGARQ